jgi:hypothetical protein
MKKMVICCVFLFSLALTAHCGQLSRIELTDGSVIEAEVVSLDNGTYTLKSASLGEIKVDANRVRGISNAAGESGDDFKAQMEKVKAKMQDNPEVMKIVTGLVADPQFQDLLKDPNVINAAKSQDINALMKNEKITNLINHPQVKEIENKLDEQKN